MTSTFRTITSGTLEWRGILIQLTFERQRFVDHLQIETIDPARAPLPITETGYRSHFIRKNLIENADGADAYIEDWLNHAAGTKAWAEREAEIRQYSLF